METRAATGLLVALASTACCGLACGQTSPDKSEEFTGAAQQLFFVNTAYVAPPGGGQLLLRSAFARNGKADAAVLTLDGQIGLFKNTAIEVSLPYNDIDDGTSTQSGVGDLFVGAQLHLFSFAEPRGLVAASLGVTIPTGDSDKGLGSGELDVLPGLATSIELDSSWILHGSVGGVLGNSEKSLNYGVAAEHVFGEGNNWSAILELTGFTGAGTEVYATPGIEWRPCKNWALNVGVSAGLTDRSADWGVIFQVYWSF